MHIGKFYPRSVHADWTTIPEVVQTAAPPRKLRYWNEDFGVHGTLLVPWVGLTIVSEVGEMDNDGPTIFWIINHPTVPNNYQKFIIEYQELSGPGNPQFGFTFRHEFWFEGTLYAWWEGSGPATGAFWGDGSSFFILWAQWQNSIDRSKVDIIGLEYLACAVWDDDPDFQPYNTRP